MASKEDADDKSMNDLLNRVQALDVKTEDQELSETDEINIPDWLKDCESVFFWHSLEKKGLGSEYVILRTLEKLDDLQLEEPEFSLQRYISLLKLVLEYWISGEVDKAWENMIMVENLLEEDAEGNDPLFKKIDTSLGHVVSSTKANLLALDGNEDKSRKIAQYIIPVRIMGSQDQAAIYAIRANFFLYAGYENGEEIGVQFAKKALELEPDNAEWEYLLAKIMRQQRKAVPFSGVIPKDEVKLLESAVEKSRHPKYLVYLAQVYRECGSLAFRQYRNRPGFYNNELYGTIKEMGNKALLYYKEALEVSSNHPASLRRIGYGIMNLPKDVADYDLALKCLLDSLELSENQITLHVLGTFYHRYGKDNEKALEYFTKTALEGSHAGLNDMVRIKFLLNPDYNPLEDLETGLSWKMKKTHKMHILCQLGGYFLFIKRDFLKSIEYFSQLLAEDKDSIHMKTFKSIFVRMIEPINLFEYLANEALLLLGDTVSTKSHGDGSASDKGVGRHANLDYVEDFMFKLSESHPELAEITPDPDLINRLVQRSQELLEKERNSNRDSQHNRYHNRGGRPGWRGRSGARRYSYTARGPSSEEPERRGRFSIANQRDAGADHDDDSERKGKHSNQRGSGRGNRRSNWRQESDSPRGRGGNQRSDRGKKNPSESETNWRKK